eukprot:gene6721-8331_t
MFYRCKTCALSPNSSICYECFKAGPHEAEGHDYSSSFAPYGGSCDCGSTDSWKESGFCRDHIHTDDDVDPTLNMNPDNLFSTHIVIRHLLIFLLEINNNDGIYWCTPTSGINNCNNNVYSSSNSNQQQISDKLKEEISIQIVDWLENIVTCGRSISHVLSEEFCYQRLDTSNLMTSNCAASSLRFTSYLEAPQQFRPPLEKILLLKTTSSPLSSKVSTEIKNKTYRYFARSENIDELFRFSPQLFSVSSISEQFSIGISYGFLECFFDTLTDLSLPLDKQHLAVVSDIKTIIQHASIAHYVVCEDMKLLSQFVRLLQRIQGLDPHTRCIEHHIPYVGEEWTVIFQIDTELKDIFQILIDTITKNDSLEKLKNIVEFLSKSVMEGNQLTPDKVMILDYQYMITKNDIFEGTQSVSITLPFYRFFGLLLHKITSLYNVNLQEIIPTNLNLFQLIYPFVLAHVFVHQKLIYQLFN